VSHFREFEEDGLAAPDDVRTSMVISTAGRIADRFNPVAGGPAAPLKLESLFAAFAPSLMPRAAYHQGLAAGASVLAAEAVGRGVDARNPRHVPCALGQEPWWPPPASH
jgi:hypothetical protein